MAVDEFYRAARRVRVDPFELITAFARAYVELRGMRADDAVGRNAVSLVSAQARHEMAGDATTAADDDVCFNFNLTGNKRPRRADGSPVPGVPWTTLGTHEVVALESVPELFKAGVAEPEHHRHKTAPGRVAVYFKNLGPEKSHVATHFRAFDSLDEGALFSFGKYLSPGERYATLGVIKALDACDPPAFARALKALGYYTADEGEYAGALARQLAGVRRDAARVDWAGLPVLSSTQAKRLMESGALGLWGGVGEQQQTTLAGLERARREREGSGNDGEG